MQKWNRTIENSDVVTYEAQGKEISMRIECRRHEDSTWGIFKTYYNDAINYTEEFFATSPEELSMLLSQLMKEKALTLTEISRIKRNQLKNPVVEVKRAYKEDNVEKWLFSIDGSDFDNFFVLREYDVLEIDIIVSEQYAYYENKIVEAINKILSIENLDLDVVENMYFYRKRAKKAFRSQVPSFLFNKIESDFGGDEE